MCVREPERRIGFFCCWHLGGYVGVSLVLCLVCIHCSVVPACCCSGWALFTCSHGLFYFVQACALCDLFVLQVNTGL